MFREVFLLVFSVFILAFASEAPGEGTFGKTAALLIFSGAMLITYGLVYLLPKQKNLSLVILLASTALLFLVFRVQDPFSLHITLLSIWGLAFVIGGYGIHKRRLLSVRFILPFTIPYLALTVTADYFPPYLSLAALAATLLIFPWFLKLFWGFEPLENPYLKERLEAFCRRAKFRHRGLYTWKVQNHTITAAIVGALPSLRYVLFSRALIDAFTPEEIEAILAHEIGHAKYYHLWLYPLLVLGILVIGLLLIDLPFWPAFLLYFLLTALYFRFVFGYFSRLFERQADIASTEVGASVETMVSALDRIGSLSGGTHHKKCWHHFGISERIAFLEAGKKEPKLFKNHHAKVYLSLAIYCLVLGILWTI